MVSTPPKDHRRAIDQTGSFAKVQPSFLELPYEIRMEIYKHALVGNVAFFRPAPFDILLDEGTVPQRHELVFDRYGCQYEDYFFSVVYTEMFTRICFKRSSLCLLGANKQIQEEAKPVLFDLMRVVVEGRATPRAVLPLFETNHFHHSLFTNALGLYYSGPASTGTAFEWFNHIPSMSCRVRHLDWIISREEVKSYHRDWYTVINSIDKFDEGEPWLNFLPLKDHLFPGLKSFKLSCNTLCDVDDTHHDPYPILNLSRADFDELYEMLKEMIQSIIAITKMTKLEDRSNFRKQKIIFTLS